jgi:hypothetical protein
MSSMSIGELVYSKAKERIEVWKETDTNTPNHLI